MREFCLSVLLVAYIGACSATLSFAGDYVGIATDKYLVRVPKNWKAVEYVGDPNCTYLKKEESLPHQSFTVMICVREGREGVVANRAGFFFRDGIWVKTGSMDEQPATLDWSAQFPKISGVASCGITDDTGFHAAGGNCYSAIVFGDGYGVLIETDGTEKDLSLVANVVGKVIPTNPANIESIKRGLKQAEEQ